MIYVLRQWKDGNIKGVCAHMERHCVAYRVIEAWEAESLPPISRGDAILALGGPPSVCKFNDPDYDVQFLIREAAYLRHARDLEVPVMGICLGHQLVAAMRGNTVAQGELVFGIEGVETTLHARDHWLYAGVPSRFWVYQHHRDAVMTVSEGATVLASSETCAVESVAWDDFTVSTQFHPEVLRSDFPIVLEKFNDCVRAQGIEISDMLARLPQDYETTTNRIFDNFLYRAAAIERPSWMDRKLFAA